MCTSRFPVSVILFKQVLPRLVKVFILGDHRSLAIAIDFNSLKSGQRMVFGRHEFVSGAGGICCKHCGGTRNELNSRRGTDGKLPMCPDAPDKHAPPGIPHFHFSPYCLCCIVRPPISLVSLTRFSPTRLFRTLSC